MFSVGQRVRVKDSNFSDATCACDCDCNGLRGTVTANNRNYSSPYVVTFDGKAKPRQCRFHAYELQPEHTKEGER